MCVVTIEEGALEELPWKLYFDGASNAAGNGIRAVLGEWETRDPKLINYQKLVLELVKKFDGITFRYLLRDESQMVDALATLASMIKVNKKEDVKPIRMSIYETSAYCYNIEEDKEKDDHLWYHDILQYIRNREYPD
ncbi:uncharacterized protein [Gossypium hirsutum]|uniref:RNase H type-1 domain-containing protein n=1 Tax=Gossypium hirsutum TaxID=3635 RepID=A0ABM2YHR6_GOSHI|nr:uncharacterized protein LOC121203708 [Gossypium hirsutum]